MSNSISYARPQLEELVRCLAESRRFLRFLAGPRQVGKTTLVRQAAAGCGLPHRYASADQSTLRGIPWLEREWGAARQLTDESGDDGALLLLDEIQKVPGWSETVKRLWDEDARAQRPLRVIVLGSTPLPVLPVEGDSFERLYLPHWSFPEMKAAFGSSLEEFIFYGAYPGATSLIPEPKRWRLYIRDSLIEPVISRDVLLLSRVDKPALLRRLIELGCLYSGQALSYTKMLGQLQDRGNTTTLAHYLDLLGGAGMLAGLGKYSGSKPRGKGSSPKLQVFNNALMTAQDDRSFDGARSDPAYWGHLVESGVGAHLLAGAAAGDYRLHYWRENSLEVDFVLSSEEHLLAIEVKSGRPPAHLPGVAAFKKAFPTARSLLVGRGGIPLAEFLSRPGREWLAG